MSDAVPPSAAVAFFDAGGQSRRSSAYQGLLGALLPEGGSDLPVFLKDKYAAWVSYRDGWWSANPTSTLTQEQLFAQWANRTLDSRTASQAINTYKQAANAPLNQALDAYVAPGGYQQFVNSAGTAYSLPLYSATADAATQAINNGAAATIHFDSSTMDSQLTHTTVEGAASGMYSIFSAGASGSFDQLNTQAATSGWTVEGYINKYATLVTQPGSWFSSFELGRAFNAPNDNSVWDPMANAGTWNSFFGQPDGTLARRVTQLFLVSDYQLTVTSHATYTQSDVQEIQTQADFGVWPFFSASASATHTSDFELNSDSTMSITHTLNKGLIQIWGVSVQNAPA
jgi:hypothetical protein